MNSCFCTRPSLSQLCRDGQERALLGTIPKHRGLLRGRLAEEEEEEFASGGLLHHRHASEYRRPLLRVQVV